MDFLLLLTRIILVFVGCVSSLPTQDLDHPWLAQSDQSVHTQPGTSSLVDPIPDKVSIVPYRIIPTEPDIQLVGAEPSNQPSQDVVGLMTTSDQNSHVLYQLATSTPEDEDVNFVSCSEAGRKNTKGAAYLGGTNTGSFCPRTQYPEELGTCKTKWFLRCSGPKYGKLVISVKNCKPSKPLAIFNVRET